MKFPKGFEGGVQYPSNFFRVVVVTFRLACVAWWFLSNLRALGKRGSRDKDGQNREEPGRETIVKQPSYAG